MDVSIPKLKQTTLANVSDDKAFWICRGDRIHNITDLANCIESLTPAQFKYHVDNVKKTTHFSQWISDVLGNPLLARDVQMEPNLSDQRHLVKTIRDHINWLQHTHQQIVHV